MYERIASAICGHSFRYPAGWILFALLLCLPALSQIGKVGIDTSVVRLLPDDSPASRWTRELEPQVSGERSFFYLLLEGEEKKRLVQAVDAAVEQAESIQGVNLVVYKNPVEFFEEYRFLLIPSSYLTKVLQEVLRWETKINPFVVNLLDDDPESEDSFKREQDRAHIRHLLERYGNLPLYHQSNDGKTMGIIVYPETGLSNISDARVLFEELTEISGGISSEFDVWVGVGGSLSRWINGSNIILTDLRRSGIIAVLSILAIVTVGFRRFRVIPVLLFPLCLGLLWSISLVPVLVGDLNTITAFFLIVSFGLGIDFSIHLVKRFQSELSQRPASEALTTTFQTTGKSVFLSGLTTAFALLTLSVSEFKGVSEFGLIGAVSLLAITLAMLLFLPAAVVAGVRLNLVSKARTGAKRAWVMGPALTLSLAACIGVSLFWGIPGLEFDLDFNKLGGSVNESQEIRDRQNAVYPSSLPPAAVFVADGMESLDEFLQVLAEVKGSNPSTTIGRVSTIRDFFPDESEAEERRGLIGELRTHLKGKWTERIEDEVYRSQAVEFASWDPPDRGPALDAIPEILKNKLLTASTPRGYVVAIYPNVERRHGKNTMAFTEELYDLALPRGIKGPMGETPVMAEILWIVTSEGPWLVLVTFVGVALLVFASQLSVRDTIWMMLPLIAGMAVMIGIMAGFGLKVNFYNIVVFPALLGMGVDDGVHYFRRWKDNRGDTGLTQQELLVPLTLTTMTTMMGYAGLMLARHPGLYSIGALACIGLFSTWFTTLFLLPGLLKMVYRNRDS